MQLDRIAAPISSGRVAKATASQSPSGAAGFDSLLQGEAAAAAEESEAVMAPTAAGQSAYAAAYQAEMADREARRHGRAMLQALAALQMAVLDGSAEQARDSLQALAGRSTQAHDPVLRLILREIGVRAAVELGRQPGIPNVSVA
jgi:L-alanine-DL-glutamate epimerase-like enolase superfamily enzyme